MVFLHRAKKTLGLLFIFCLTYSVFYTESAKAREVLKHHTQFKFKRLDVVTLNLNLS